jgi:hypothetical protein
MKLTKPYMDKISPIGDFKYPIGDIIPNWGYYTQLGIYFC